MLPTTGDGPRMKISIISQWFQPEPGTGRGRPFAKWLHAGGHDVRALTGFPNYPGGRIYPGYKMALLQRERMDPIEVLRVPLYPSHDQSGARRVASYVSFAAAA